MITFTPKTIILLNDELFPITANLRRQTPGGGKTMNDSVLFNFNIRSRMTAGLICLLAFQSIPAKSNPPSTKTQPEQPRELILSLPSQDAPVGGKPTWSENLRPLQNADDTNPIIAGGKKKPAVNVDCGMDVYQNSGPDISLTSRLTGECDLKYRY